MDTRALHGITATQHWLFTREQALDHVGLGALKYALRTGEIVRRIQGVYGPWGAPDSWERDLHAVCLAGDAVASHRSAARLHAMAVPAQRLEVTVPAPRQTRLDMPRLIVHESNLLLPEFVTTVDHIPVTTPERTCIDLSAVLSPDSTERAWASADYLGLVTVESLQRTAILMLARGRRRMTVVRHLLDNWVSGAGADSELAAQVLRWILQDGLPAPDVQLWVVVRGDRYCLDLAWPQWKVCVECDGWLAHRVRTRFDSDRDKVPELQLAGWLVIPATARQPRHVVMDRIRRALADRGAPSPESG